VLADPVGSWPARRCLAGWRLDPVGAAPIPAGRAIAAGVVDLVRLVGVVHPSGHRKRPAQFGDVVRCGHARRLLGGFGRPSRLSLLGGSAHPPASPLDTHAPTLEDVER
jgi:hypothetical protein